MPQVKRFICCLLLLSPVVMAQPLWVVTEVTPPLQAIENEQVTGEITDTVRQILNKAQIQADFYAYPWARSYNLAQNRKNTLIYPLARTPEREGRFIWLAKVLSMQLSFVKLSSNPQTNIHSLDDARQYVIGVSRHDMTHKVLLGLGFEEGKNLLLTADFISLVELLYAGKIDCLIGNIDKLRQLVTSQGRDPSSLNAEFPFPLKPDYYLAAHRDTEQKIIQAIMAVN